MNKIFLFLKKTESNVKFATETMATGKSGREVSSATSFSATRTKFLHNPGVPMATDDERLKFELENKDKTKGKKPRKRREKSASLDPYETEDKETRRLRELRECIHAGESNKDIHERLKTLMLRHVRVLDDLTKLRNHYYAVYMNKLNDKVEDQRREIQRRTDQLNRRILRKELQEKRESHKLKKRHEKSSLNHDNTFLENLPRTKLHQIICLEEKLMKEGKFRTIEDLENFWSDIEKPENLQLLFGGGEALTTGGYGTHIGSQEDIHTEPSLCNSVTSSLTSLNQEDGPTDTFTRGLSQIYEDSEPSRPGTKTGGSQSWAVTQQFKKVDKAGKNGRKMTSPSLKEQDPDPTVQLGKVEFPQLSCFTMDLEPPKEDPEAIRLREEYRLKARMRDYEKKRIQKMYETSLTHQAATQRILGKNAEFLDVLRGPSLADVVNAEATASSSDCNSDILVDDLGLDRPLLALTMSGEDSSRSQRRRQGTEKDGGRNSHGGSTRQSSASSTGSQSR
ncbi:uncharacterized protein LOC119722149 isoform X2 [Patiria miniata]|uniref:Uncharacterized protein n=1 Tax=Patiria miniata TaxID=46514 RepID=A0A913Z900_PATMI|nr:uncharacterized protein LOC119722149 isoform X2 [Patiria miniata]